MILVATLNPALDVTYDLDRVDWDGTNRPTGVGARAGGKGLNVARTLSAMGAEVAVIGFVGGCAGDSIRAELSRSEIHDLLQDVEGETRRTITVFERSSGRTAAFNEPGPQISKAEWLRFVTWFEECAEQAEAVVLTGSLPRELAPNSYSVLIGIATRRGLITVLDAEGDALRYGCRARPNLVKPNLTEFQELVGRTVSAPDEFFASMAALRSEGPQAVVVSRGPEGLMAAAAAGNWWARPPHAREGNPTGAGDSAVAVLTIGLIKGKPWPRLLAEAVAVSAAVVGAESPGLDMATSDRLLPSVVIEPF